MGDVKKTIEGQQGKQRYVYCLHCKACVNFLGYQHDSTRHKDVRERNMAGRGLGQQLSRIILGTC